MAGRGAIAVSMVAAVTTVWSALAALGFSICAAFLYLVASVQSDKISAWELKERLRLQQRIAARRISPEQEARLVASLVAEAGAVYITHMSGAEPFRLALDLVAAFKRAGWTVTNALIPGGYWEGILLCDAPDAPRVADALRHAGIPFEKDDERKDLVNIMVGAKPDDS